MCQVLPGSTSDNREYRVQCIKSCPLPSCLLCASPAGLVFNFQRENGLRGPSLRETRTHNLGAGRWFIGRASSRERLQKQKTNFDKTKNPERRSNSPPWRFDVFCEHIVLSKLCFYFRTENVSKLFMLWIEASNLFRCHEVWNPQGLARSTFAESLMYTTSHPLCEKETKATPN